MGFHRGVSMGCHHLSWAAAVVLLASWTGAISLDRIENRGISRFIEINIVYNQTNVFHDDSPQQYELTHTSQVLSADQHLPKTVCSGAEKGSNPLCWSKGRLLALANRGCQEVKESTRFILTQGRKSW